MKTHELLENLCMPPNYGELQPNGRSTTTPTYPKLKPVEPPLSEAVEAPN
jgi:hypothetical protein